MHSNKLRPQSANFRKVTKSRVVSGHKPSPPQEFNPWSTVYREATKAPPKNQIKVQNEHNDFSDLMSVQSVNKPNATSKNKANKENLEKNVKKGFFVQKGLKSNVSSDNKSVSNRLKTEQISQNNRSELIDNPDPLKSTIREIIHKPCNTTNPLGQKETYLDPKDASKCPAYTRVIANANDKDFLKKNIHTLYKSPNEYYPLIGGECLCGYCICGNCKCVHMKFKTRDQNTIGQPLSRTDFVDHGPVFGNKQIVRPQQIVKPPNEFVKDSLYKTDYVPKGLNSNEPKFLNKARVNNLGPCATNIKAPIAQITNNKLDFPDWGYQKAEPLQVQPLMTKKMPSTFKTQNQDYGGFFNEADAQPLQNMVKHVPKRSNNFFGPNLPMDYDSQQKKDFKDQGMTNTEIRMPKDNLYTDGENFATKFKSIKQDYGDHPQVLSCPVKERIKKVKELMKTYANENHIPL